MPERTSGFCLQSFVQRQAKPLETSEACWVEMPDVHVRRTEGETTMGSQSPPRTADFIVAGSGHNGLITACYLAKAGYSVIALDAAAIPGGGAATEELLL